MNRRDFLKLSGLSILGGILALQEFDLAHSLSASARIGSSLSFQPNVILVTLDTVRAKSLSLYGYPKDTSPNLKRISKEGVLFNRAIATSSWTLPSHAGMFTGRFQRQLKVDFVTPLDRTFTTLAEILQAQGYQTGGFIANREYCSKEYGLDRGFSHYEDYRTTVGQAAITPSYGKQLIAETHVLDRFQTNENFGRKGAPILNRDFLHWLDRINPEQPFFAFLNYFDAHDPYLTPDEYKTKLGFDAVREFYENLKSTIGVPLSELKELSSGYHSAIAYLDDHIGALYDSLKSNGWLDNTIFIITSDHGEQFGEHGLTIHGNSLYMDLIWVPLIVIAPGIKVGTVIDQPISLRNLPSTIINLVGATNLSEIPGQPISLLKTDQSPLPVYSELKLEEYSVVPPMKVGWQKSLVVGDYHYIRNPDESEQLFLLNDDPDEINNLAANVKYKDLLADLREQEKIAKQ